MSSVKLSLRQQQILCCMLWGGNPEQPITEFVDSPWRQRLNEVQSNEVAASIATEGPDRDVATPDEVLDVFWGRTLTDAEGPGEIVQVVVDFGDCCANLVIDYPSRHSPSRGCLCEVNIHPASETAEVMRRVRREFMENALEDILEKAPDGGLEEAVKLLLERRSRELSPRSPAP